MLKKSTLVGIGIALIGGGIGLSIIGITLGGHMGVSIGPKGMSFAPSIKQVSTQIAENKSDTLGGRQIVNQEILPAFKNMDLEIGISEVELVTGSDYSITISMDKDIPIYYKVQGDTLFVEQEADKNWGANLGMIDAKNGLVVITVPTEVVLRESIIEAGVGDWLIDGLNLEDLEMTIGVGDVKIENVRAKKMDVTGGVGDTEIYDMNAESLIIEGGVGDIKAKSLISNEVELTANVGDVDIEGTFEGNITMEGGIGEMKLTTSLGEESYNYDIRKGIGKTKINGRKVGDLENYRQDNRAAYTLSIESGLGDVTINTLH